jgi:RNA polymerase sigma-70 factor (ECF subfamily)
MKLTEHLFRHEWGRMVAAVTRIFGVHNLALAEDVVQEAFCRAVEVWPFGGVPENPSAWLMATAKNCALDVLRRERTARTYAPELGRLLESEWTLAPVIEDAFAPHAIKDDLLRMMLSCCHPQLAQEGQVALILHILCGFSVDEIASALISTHAAIEKRLTRGRKTLAKSKKLFDVTAPAEFSSRLPSVHTALYLLFNEGYHGANPEFAVRSDLCREAMRLTAVLLEHPLGATPTTHALGALMCLNAARLPARIDAAGNLSSLFDQDRSVWDRQLIAEGMSFLELSAKGSDVNEYHLEAAIASIHAAARAIEDTDWSKIVSLYDTLMMVRPSPIVALNRAIAIAQRDGPDRGIEEIQAITDRDRLKSYPFYWAALGEFGLRSRRYETAEGHFRSALALARNESERHFFGQRLQASQTAVHS